MTTNIRFLNSKNQQKAAISLEVQIDMNTVKFALYKKFEKVEISTKFLIIDASCNANSKNTSKYSEKSKKTCKNWKKASILTTWKIVKTRFFQIFTRFFDFNSLFWNFLVFFDFFSFFWIFSSFFSIITRFFDFITCLFWF